MHLIIGFALVWAAILGGIWLGWQLLRQNGRVLLRLDELEKRLNELEFGDAEEPEGLPLGSEAPTFELPDLSGERKSMAQFRGQPALLIFFNPDCGFCRELMPKLAALAHSSDPGSSGRESAPSDTLANHCRLTSAATAEHPLPLIVTTGDGEKNRQFFAEHGVGCPVLLQNDGEIAKAYQANGTPTGYLVGADGKIASELAIGAEALLKLAGSKPAHENGRPLTPALSPGGGEGVRRTGVGETQNPANRFNNGSLARSKIKRDGLKAGTPAPDFRLPRLDGRGDLSLAELRGRQMLLVFSDPHCGPCNLLAPELEKFHRQQVEVGRVTPCAPQRDGMFQNGAQGTDAPYPISVVMISKGQPKENRAKVKEHGLTFPVVLQQQWEISRRYAMFATPIAYFIDEAGIVTHDVAVGIDAIRELMSRTVRPLQDEQELARSKEPAYRI